MLSILSFPAWSLIEVVVPPSLRRLDRAEVLRAREFGQCDMFGACGLQIIKKIILINF